MPSEISGSFNARVALRAHWALLLLLFAVAALMPLKTEAATTLIKTANNLGLVGYWSFNEGTSTIATDFSGNGNHGTLTNMSASNWVNGMRGKALDFIDSDDYVSVANPTSFNFGTADFAIATWVRRDVAGDEDMLISKTADGAWESGGKLFNVGATNKLFLDQNGVGFVDSTGTITDTNWHHVAVTFTDSSNAVEFYIDGVSAGSDVYTWTEHIEQNPSRG